MIVQPIGTVGQAVIVKLTGMANDEAVSVGRAVQAQREEGVLAEVLEAAGYAGRLRSATVTYFDCGRADSGNCAVVIVKPRESW